MTGMLRQIALLDGPEAGQEAIAVSTGRGLDFWLLLGRGLDIGPLWWRGVQVAWQHPAGLVAPQFIDPSGDGGTGLERGFGGMLVTCGLDHIRQPVDGAPLHGHHPFTPAKLTRCEMEDDRMIVEAVTVTYHLKNGGFRLRRRMEASTGASTLSLTDSIENLGPVARPLQLLYQWNFGPPWSDTGRAVELDAEPIAEPGSKNPDCRSVESGLRQVSVRSQHLGHVTLSFDGGDLPYLQTWISPDLNLLSIEPATSTRREGGASETAKTLAPGTVRAVRQTLSFC